jgi:uncharacterized protein
MPSDPVGRVVEIWRYPLTSVGGERLAHAEVGPDGVVGDREYGLIDSVTGQPAAPEKDIRWRKALHLNAASDSGTGPVLVFPDCRTYRLDDPALNGVLADYFGFPAAIAAYAHTKRPMGFPLTRYRHPHFPLHMLTTASLRKLADLRKAAAIDSRRFRPTVVIDAGEAEGFVENRWIGRRMRLGGTHLTVQEDTKRCGVTFISQPGLKEDPDILRSILRHNGRNLGIYCSIEGPGTIEVGEELSFV